MVLMQEIKDSFKKEHLESPIIKYFYYPLTLFICQICIKWGINANVINIIGVFANIIAAGIILIAKNQLAYVLAGLIVIFAYTTDFCDGTIARYYKNKKELASKVTPMYGKWSDEIAGLIGVSFLFSVAMIKIFLETNQIGIIIWGTIAIIGFMMMNFAAILSELIRKRFEIENPADKLRNSISKKLWGINPRMLSFGFEIQWTLIILGVLFNQFYALFVIFAILSNLQWLARYYVFFGK